MVYQQMYSHFAGFADQKTLKKGVCLLGPVGTGKTIAFRVMRHIFSSFGMVNAPDIPLEFINTQSISKWSTYQPKPELLHTNQWCIDDLGFEVEFNREIKTNLVANILTKRYELQQRFGILTYASTNLDKKKIFKAYGPRLEDRIPLMFNFIPMKGTSLRIDLEDPGEKVTVKYKVDPVVDDPLTEEQIRINIEGLDVIKKTIAKKAKPFDESIDWTAAAQREKEMMNRTEKPYIAKKPTPRQQAIRDFQDKRLKGDLEKYLESLGLQE